MSTTLAARSLAAVAGLLATTLLLADPARAQEPAQDADELRFTDPFALAEACEDDPQLAEKVVATDVAVHDVLLAFTGRDVYPVHAAMTAAGAPTDTCYPASFPASSSRFSPSGR